MTSFNSSVELWDYILMIIFTGSAITLILTQILLRLTLDRRIRKAMPADKVYDGPLDTYGGWMRSMGFGYAAVFERAKNYAMKDYYDGFDVKTFANNFEKLISYLFIISSFTLLSCMIFFLFTKFFGIIAWPE